MNRKVFCIIAVVLFLMMLIASSCMLVSANWYKTNRARAMNEIVWTPTPPPSLVCAWPMIDDTGRQYCPEGE